MENLARIPNELILLSIQKMEPKSFVRTFRSCRRMTTLIEENRKRISIPSSIKLCLEEFNDPENKIVVRALRGPNVTYWSEATCHEKLVSTIIPKLAFFRFAEIWIKVPIDEKFSTILSTFKKYRITAEVGTILAQNSMIHEIIETLKLETLKIDTPIRMEKDCYLKKEDTQLLRNLRITNVSPTVADKILHFIAPQCLNLVLKISGAFDCGNIFSFIKKIQQKENLYCSGQISFVPMNLTYPDSPDLADKFSKKKFYSNLDLIMLPLQENGFLAVVWKKIMTPLNRIRQIHVYYSILREREESIKFYKQVYSNRYFNETQNALNDCFPSN